MHNEYQPGGQSPSHSGFLMPCAWNLEMIAVGRASCARPWNSPRWPAHVAEHRLVIAARGAAARSRRPPRGRPTKTKPGAAAQPPPEKERHTTSLRRNARPCRRRGDFGSWIIRARMRGKTVSPYSSLPPFTVVVAPVRKLSQSRNRPSDKFFGVGPKWPPNLGPEGKWKLGCPVAKRRRA